MTKLKLPPPPEGIKAMRADHAQPLLLTWLMGIARSHGGPALEHALALGGGWPGTDEQRASISEAHADVPRNEAIQLSSETSYRDARARGEWGV